MDVSIGDISRAEFARSSALTHVEARRPCSENSCYRPHTHSTLSIGFIDAGATTFAGAEGRTLRLEAGDAIVIPAGYVHACNPDDGHWMYRMIHVDQEWLAAQAPCDALFDMIRVLSGPRVRQVVGEVIDLVFADAEEAELVSAFQSLVSVLSDSAPKHTLRADQQVGDLPRLGPVIERLQNDPVNPKVRELAQLVGMDQFQLIREMKRATGFSPLAWRQNARVLLARQLLRDGASISDTVHALGFADQSHFHRVFRAHVAASPGAYRSGSQKRTRHRAR